MKPKLVDRTGVSAEQLYADTQCGCCGSDGSDGDVLVTDFGLVIMVKAWPVSVNVSTDDQYLTGIHRLNKATDWDHYDAGRYAKSYALALSEINQSKGI